MKGIPYINRGDCGILLLSEIYYIDCTYRTADIHTESGVKRMYISPGNLGKYLDERFNISLNTLIINFDKVRSMTAGHLTFENGEVMDLSRNCYFKVRRDFVDYLKNIQKTLANS
ncbi:MAG: hypothetical protein IKS99_08535 [Firmicutes bacterium]|nr:hypothetical protein [Bacillota bacterium]